ncbi:ImmA/IrrE family metallo-endopeptidase [Magnetospira sp. QH-2]|uniref:helix-turn-helix domain-containing protein n=1 Tax=Magnetospira sp. (strain QH-2) TaxID=1288970 RepID=UPI0003E815B5|nr:XRE family transcriptional regulator [Magnetospira sp. QH-2]CCQ72759.1 putative DNA-binding protein [Magnetospira sp. QH-2]
MFGERLKLARKKAGLSLRALSDEMGGIVSAQAIGKYERDEMMPNSTVLISLCKTLGVGMDFFAAPTGAKLVEVDFRKHSGTKAQERAEVEARVIEHVERYLIIEEILNLDSAAWHAPFKRRSIEDIEDAEGIASEVRERWNLGLDPIPNLTELLEEKGIKVMMLSLPNNVSGLTCIVERKGVPDVPVIVVNKDHPLERRRMTLAHELGHRLFEAPSKIEEKAATRFAGAFLMPSEHIIREVGDYRHFVGVEEVMTFKRMYRVSAAAFIVRLRDIDILSNDKLTRIFRSVGRTWRRTEPNPIESEERSGHYERPKRFQRLCYRALAEDLISVTKAAELLGEPVKLVETAMTEGLSGAKDRHQ